MTPEEARAVARETVNQLFDRFGVDLNNSEQVEEFRRDLQFARKQRKGAEQMSVWIKQSAIGAFVLGALWTFLWGLQRIFGGGA